jgi:hypothetical protein
MQPLQERVREGGTRGHAYRGGQLAGSQPGEHKVALRADLGAQLVRGRLGVTVGAQDHDRHSGQRPLDRGKQPPGARVRPLQVVHHQQERARRRRLPDARHDRLEQQEPGQPGIGLAGYRAQRLADAELAEQLAPHPERRRAVIFRAAHPRAAEPVLGQPGRARARQPGLADARLAADQPYPAPPLRRRAHRRAVQLAQLRDPSGQHGPDLARPTRRFQSRFRRADVRIADHQGKATSNAPRDQPDGQRFLMTILRYTRLPAPSSTATPPSTTSGMSWKPAVPPPPVAGAPTGNGLGDGLGDGDADTDGVAEGVADGVAEGVALALSLGEAVAVPLALGVGVAVPPGENEDPAEGGVDPVQAETVAEASMVMVPQPRMVSPLRSPVTALAPRTIMDPPQRQAPESAGGRTAEPIRRHTQAMT